MAIILVVIQHSCGSLYNSGIHTNGSLPIIITIIGTFHMALFMFLSGFVFALAYCRRGIVKTEKFKMQFENLCLLYIEFSLLRYVFKTFFNDQVNNSIDKFSILKIPFQAIDELWFLYALIVLYLITYIAMKNTQNIKIMMLICLISLVYRILGVKAPWSFDRVCHYALFFVGGVMAEQLGVLEGQKYNYSKVRPSLLVVSVFTCVFLLFVLSESSIIYNITSIFVAVIMCMLLLNIGFAIERSTTFIGGVLRKLGRHTLEIYLIHVYCTAGLRVLIRKLPINNVVIDVMLLTLFGIIVPLGISSVADKIGILDWIFKPIKMIRKMEKRESH